MRTIMMQHIPIFKHILTGLNSDFIITLTCFHTYVQEHSLPFCSPILKEVYLDTYFS